MSGSAGRVAAVLATLGFLAVQARGQASAAVPTADQPKAMPPKPLSAKAPYQEYVVPVGQREAHQGANKVIALMGFEFPVMGPTAATGTDLDDQWQRFQFQGMSRFTSIGPEEGTIIAVRVEDDKHTGSAAQSTLRSTAMSTGLPGGRGGGHGASLNSAFQIDPHPGNYHAYMLRADFTDVADGTRIQIWITEATLAVNSLSGNDFGSTVGQLNIPVADSPLYGRFITKLAALLKGPKPVGIAPSTSSAAAAPGR